MSTWREEEPPANYSDLLYAKDEEYQSEFELSDVEIVEAGSRPETPEPDAPPYSPLSPPQHRESGREARERSRSPIRPQQPSESIPIDVVVEIIDQDWTQLEADDSYTEVFLAADAHTIFVSPVKNDESEGNVTERGRSGRRSGRRGGRRGDRGTGRGRGRGRGQYRRGRQDRWELGHPLKEIWLTDDDVPAELVNLVRNVIRRRELRMQERNEGERNRIERGNESEDEDDDEFFDASEEGISREFLWSPMDSFQGREECFLPKRTGATQIFNSAYDAFRSYWDDDVLSLIVTETNLYATTIQSPSFQAEWYPTNIHEILVLFGFWMMFGIIRMPTIKSCFSADPLLNTEIFKRLFTRNRYENLSRALHFVESSPRSADRLQKIRPIISHLNMKFKEKYVLSKEISIDESLTLWKGRLDIKQYIKTKAAKYGIKTFELCESATGYLWSFIVYTGKQSSDLNKSPGELKSTTIVKQLMGPLLNKGYQLFMDNWYNSPRLARFLKKNGTDCIGTLRSNKRDVPVLINEAPLKRGELIARHSGDVMVMAWQDKKRVTMISTCHDSSTALPRVPSRRLARPVPYKPKVVLDYNKFMGGVDVKDQMLEPYLIERKRCNKWYMKVFKRLINVSILNSRILLASSKHKNYDHLSFRLELVDSILQNHLSSCHHNRRFTASITRSAHQVPDKITSNKHWPALIGDVMTSSSNGHDRHQRKRCVYCTSVGSKSKKTIYRCESCNVPLCVENCFKLYHKPY